MKTARKYGHHQLLRLTSSKQDQGRKKTGWASLYVAGVLQLYQSPLQFTKEIEHSIGSMDFGLQSPFANVVNPAGFDEDSREAINSGHKYPMPEFY